jgi:hypothetical protein
LGGPERHSHLSGLGLGNEERRAVSRKDNARKTGPKAYKKRRLCKKAGHPQRNAQTRLN